MSASNERPRWHLWVIFSGVPISLLLGTVGFWLSCGATPGWASKLDAAYRSLQLLFLRMSSVPQIHWTLELARWMAAGLIALAALYTFLKLFGPEVQQLCLHLPWRRHVLILGLGPMTTQLVRCYRNSGHRVVVVAPSADDDGVGVCRNLGATVVVGPLTDSTTLIRARIHRATQVIALSPEDNTNVAIAEQVHNLVQNKAGPCRRDEHNPLKCFVHIGNVDARSTLQASAAFADDCRCEMHFFDLFDVAVRKLFQDRNLMVLDRGGIKEGDVRQVHLVILGFGRMGQTVAVRAAQLGHFANRKPLRISVIDQQAAQRRQALLFRYPNFEKTCQIDFHEQEAESDTTRDFLGQCCADPSTVVTILSCFDKDALALEMAVRLQSVLDDCDAVMYVRMSGKAGFASVLQRKDGAPMRVHAFGMQEDCCQARLLHDPLNEQLARAIHKDYCVGKIESLRRQGKDPAKEPSVREWNGLLEGLKDSNRQQADQIDIKLHAIGLERIPVGAAGREPVERLGVAEVALLAEMEHNRWNAERWLQGWTLGPSDKARKISPYLVPWSNLDEETKEFDRETVRKIPEFLKPVGQKVCRKE
jgi:hypothetical protein